MRGRAVTGKELAAATSIGPSRLIRLTTPQTTSRLRLRITKAAVAPALAELGVYLEPQHALDHTAKERCVTSEAAVLVRARRSRTRSTLIP